MTTPAGVVTGTVTVTVDEANQDVRMLFEGALGDSPAQLQLTAVVVNPGGTVEVSIGVVPVQVLV